MIDCDDTAPDVHRAGRVVDTAALDLRRVADDSATRNIHHGPTDGDAAARKAGVIRNGAVRDVCCAALYADAAARVNPSQVISDCAVRNLNVAADRQPPSRPEGSVT